MLNKSLLVQMNFIFFLRTSSKNQASFDISCKKRTTRFFMKLLSIHIFLINLFSALLISWVLFLKTLKKSFCRIIILFLSMMNALLHLISRFITWRCIWSSYNATAHPPSKKKVNFIKPQIKGMHFLFSSS